MIYNKNMEYELNYELFKNPTSEYRGLPFWSWNCKINKETIDIQLEIFKEMGFGGVVIHPRDGLDTEYLGDEYMSMIKHTVEKCNEMNLICWLYDDDRFPSGAADGIVTKNPCFRARQLRLTAKKLGNEYCSSKEEFDKAIEKGLIPKGYFICSYEIKIKDKKLAEYRKTENADESSNSKIRYAYVELQEESEWFEGQAYIDTMNPKAIDKFITVTHENYKRVLGDDFGKTASAIFTDEPRLGKQVQISEAESDEDVYVPYTDYFAEEFKNKYGFDPLWIVPEYIWDREDSNMYGRYIYREMAKECFSKVFMDRISNWCHDNGIMMTGHILGEENLTSQTTTVGDAMRTYKEMDIPGVDILIDGREFSTVKQAESVAAQYGREGVMSELYGVTNWDCTFKTYKLQGDWQAALGITIRVPHLSHMTIKGEAKRDWPASIFYQSPWYKEYPYIENHFARLNTVLTRGKRITKIAMMHPVESMWIKSGSDDVTGDIRRNLEKKFSKITKLLLYNTLDFDYISESLFSQQITECKNMKIGVGEKVYDAVIVPNMLTIRDTTLDILEKFVERGGKLIFVGDIPKYVNGMYSKRASELAKKCECVDIESVIESIEYLRDIEITDDNGSRSENLFCHFREDNSCKWLFICHVNKTNGIKKEHYKIKIKGEYCIELYDTMTGERFNVPSYTENGYSFIKWNCYGEDSVLFRLCNCTNTLKEYTEQKSYRTVSVINKVKDFKCKEPNVLLLDYARFSVDNGELCEKDENLKVDNKIRKYLGFTQRTGMDRQPWATEITEEHSVDLYYDFVTEKEIMLQLGIENPHKCSIYLNGEKADNSAVDWYVDKSIKVVNLPKAKEGQNKLKITLKYNQKTMIENLYLLGDFDVKQDGQNYVITEKKENISFGNITKQGMPFYTGNLEYISDFEVDEENEYFVKIPKFSAPVIGVFIDGQNQGLIAYTPHRLRLGRLNKGKHELKLVLFGNRFNAFGALHNANENYLWYGNGSYRTTGEEWTDNYMLRSFGIFDEVLIECIEE